MKLDCGQAITPVPCPIHSSPVASASRPRTRSSLRMAFSPAARRVAFTKGHAALERGWNPPSERSWRAGGRPDQCVRHELRRRAAREGIMKVRQKSDRRTRRAEAQDNACLRAGTKKAPVCTEAFYRQIGLRSGYPDRDCLST